MADRTPAERLDRALDSLLTGGFATRERELRPLLETADQLRIAGVGGVVLEATIENDNAHGAPGPLTRLPALWRS